MVTPHLAKIKKTGMSVQQFMTLSSLIEREGVNQTDRRKMAGVLLNRIDINMPLQSDVAVLYAIHRNNKTLTNKICRVIHLTIFTSTLDLAQVRLIVQVLVR